MKTDTLEKLWEENRKKRSITEAPRRRDSLRGRDFVDELVRLRKMTLDKRFSECVDALHEHGIIDAHRNFTRWRMPVVVEAEKCRDLLLLLIVRLKMTEGKSLRRACAETAAVDGLPAASFEAAIKHLQLLYTKSRKWPPDNQWAHGDPVAFSKVVDAHIRKNGAA
jgi:hypothetical protein